MNKALQRVMRTSPVIPVLVVTDPDNAAPLARALVDGGLKVLEVTLRAPGALDVISAMKAAVPEAIIGAGTVITPEQVDQVCAVGADFIVSPGFTADLVAAVLRKNVPFLPGVNSPSEMMQLLALGISAMKFFPAEAAGGVSFLKAVSGPLPQITFCPTGGISPDNASEYLALKNVACVGGSWMVTADDLANKRWVTIKEKATVAAALGV